MEYVFLCVLRDPSSLEFDQFDVCCVGKLWGGFSPDNNTSDAENSFRPELWLAVFAAWVGLRRLCSARCRADLNGSNVKCLVGLYACIIDKI